MRMLRVNSLLSAGCLLWIGGIIAHTEVAVPASDAAPEHAVELKRLSFQRTLVEASLAPLKRHLTEVAILERQRADARDYKGAIEARNQRKRMEEELGRLDKELLLLQTREQSLIASLLPDRIPLALEAAQLDGVRREGGVLTGWSHPGAAAKWRLPNLPPGGYEVVLRYRCGPLEGGSLVVQEARFNLKGEMDTTLKGPREKNLGTLKVSDGSGPLSITARTVVKDNLMQLLGVELIPASR